MSLLHPILIALQYHYHYYYTHLLNTDATIPRFQHSIFGNLVQLLHWLSIAGTIYSILFACLLACLLNPLGQRSFILKSVQSLAHFIQPQSTSSFFLCFSINEPSKQAKFTEYRRDQFFTHEPDSDIFSQSDVFSFQTPLMNLLTIVLRKICHESYQRCFSSRSSSTK